MGQYGAENPEDIVRALAAAMNDADPRVRRRAAFALSAFGEVGEIARDDLIRRLDDSDAEVRALAANALWTMGRSARKGLDRLYSLLADPSPMVRGRALGAVAAIDPKDPRLANALISAAKDSDGGVRLAATGMLYMAGPSAVPALIAALRDGDPMVRFEATKCCRELGPAAARAAPFLVDALRGNADAMFASVAAQALGRVGGSDAEDAVPELRRMMARPGVASLRSECALAVWRLDPARAGEVLLAMTPLLRDPLTAYYAANTLGEMGVAAAPAVPDLIRVLDAELDYVRMGAAVALGRIGAAAAPAFARLETMARDDPSARVRPKATEALALIRAALPKDRP
jgi:HEAT repeat protein